jgi:hypothetical protein
MENWGYVWMGGPKGLLPDGQRPLEERLGLGEFSSLV